MLAEVTLISFIITRRDERYNIQGVYTQYLVIPLDIQVLTTRLSKLDIWGRSLLNTNVE